MPSKVTPLWRHQEADQPWAGQVVSFHASVMLNRKDFGINMPVELGGVVLGDEVTVTLEIEALESA
jgi:polyisoprenoid-binding protein YceI